MLRFPAIVLEYAGGSLPMAIVLCAIASYIMGMGMTITAAYVILTILEVPALVELGVPLLNAHLIILWLSQDSSLTPPFALGAFVATGIAGADPTRTGFVSLMLAKPLYIVPFLMAYSPILMDPGTPWWDVMLVWVTGFVGFSALRWGWKASAAARLPSGSGDCFSQLLPRSSSGCGGSIWRHSDCWLPASPSRHWSGSSRLRPIRSL